MRNEIEPLISSLGFMLLEIRVARRKGSAGVGVIIHRPAGVGIEDCALVSRTIYPKLELLEDLGQFRLEVSSPGIGREIKSVEEYEIFKGKGISILPFEASEWTKGVIDHCDRISLYLKIQGETVEIPLTKIKRAKLAFVEEEKNNVL